MRGPNQVHIELEFKPEGELKHIGRIDLRFGRETIRPDRDAGSGPVEAGTGRGQFHRRPRTWTSSPWRFGCGRII